MLRDFGFHLERLTLTAERARDLAGGSDGGQHWDRRSGRAMRTGIGDEGDSWGRARNNFLRRLIPRALLLPRPPSDGLFASRTSESSG